jgi:hypothetical protein
MGMVYAEITLKNATDTGACKRGLMKEEEIRQATVQVIVDTGAGTLVINDQLRRQLGLEVQGKKPARLANNESVMVATAEPVEVHWKNRFMTCNPLIASEDGRVLLGAIPLQDLDLIVNPLRHELVGAHGDDWMGILY